VNRKKLVIKWDGIDNKLAGPRLEKLKSLGSWRGLCKPIG